MLLTSLQLRKIIKEEINKLKLLKENDLYRFADQMHRDVPVDANEKVKYIMELKDLQYLLDIMLDRGYTFPGSFEWGPDEIKKNAYDEEIECRTIYFEAYPPDEWNDEQIDKFEDEIEKYSRGYLRNSGNEFIYLIPQVEYGVDPAPEQDTDDQIKERIKLMLVGGLKYEKFDATDDDSLDYDFGLFGVDVTTKILNVESNLNLPELSPRVKDAFYVKTESYVVMVWKDRSFQNAFQEDDVEIVVTVPNVQCSVVVGVNERNDVNVFELEKKDDIRRIYSFFAKAIKLAFKKKGLTIISDASHLKFSYIIL